MKNSNVMRAFATILKLVLGCLVLGIVGILLCSASLDLSDRIEAYMKQQTKENTARKIPVLEASYTNIVESVAHLAKDELLEENRTKLFVHPVNVDCVIGRATFYYRANRSFEDIAAGYTKAFSRAGWSHSQTDWSTVWPPARCDDCDGVSYYYDFQNAHVALISTTEIMEHVQFSRIYYTEYYVSVTFADPRRRCIGSL